MNHFSIKKKNSKYAKAYEHQAQENGTHPNKNRSIKLNSVYRIVPKKKLRGQSSKRNMKSHKQPNVTSSLSNPLNTLLYYSFPPKTLHDSTHPQPPIRNNLSHGRGMEEEPFDHITSNPMTIGKPNNWKNMFKKNTQNPISKECDREVFLHQQIMQQNGPTIGHILLKSQLKVFHNRAKLAKYRISFLESYPPNGWKNRLTREWNPTNK